MLKLSLTTMLVLFFTINPLKAKIINEIVAVVGDEAITQYEVESFNPEKAKEIYSIKDDIKRENVLDKYYDNVLEFLVEQYSVEIAAENEGVSVSEDEVKNALNDVLSKNNITMEQLKGALQERDMTLAKYKWQIKMDILRSRVMSNVISPKVVITERDIKDYIDKHSDELELSDKYELRMIEVKDKAEMQKVKKYLQDHSFSDAAIKYSKASSSKSGGYIGLVGLKQVDDKIRKNLESTDVGSTFVVDKENSMQIFLIESFSSKYEITGDKREDIVSKIRENKMKNIYEQWLSEHKKSIYVRYK